MKKKVLFLIALVSLLACLFAIGISAETPSNYIEFGARFPGSDEYITVYTEDAEVSSGNPRINFASGKFYSDVDFTAPVDITTVTGLDFSVSKVYGSKLGYVNRITNPSSAFVNCTEVKWFTHEKAMDNGIQGSLFKGWTSLESFDFGSAKTLGDNSFEGCGFKTLVIPATVTQTYSRTFAANLSLTSVKFEGSTKLGGNASAFAGCTSLTSVDLGNVSYIGKGTFSGCTALTSITIPAGVTQIYESTFSGCSALADVVFLGNVTSIGSGAFQNALITNLSIPSTVTSIGQNAFRTSGIKNVVIPAGCTSIGNYAFHTSKIESLSFADGFTGPLSLGTGVFQGTSLLASASLAEGVTSIGQECFTGSPFATFVLPDSVTSIGNTAFGNCAQLTTFTINPTSTLQSIGSNAFKDCIKLTSFYFPNSLTSIGSNLFIYNNGSLKELINFENCGVTSIPSGVFSQCSGLKEVKFPYGVTEINGSDLLKWAKLDSITLPQTLTTISKSISATSIGKIIFAAPEGTPLPANAPNTTVEYANYCETYFGSAHLEGGATTYTYIDKDGKPTTEAYTSALKIACPCGRNCGSENVIETIPALLRNLGYSTQEYAKGGISICFLVNYDAIERYNEVMNTEISYGAFAVSQARAEGKEIIDTNGQGIEGVANVDFSKRTYDVFEIRVTGFETEDHKNAQLALGAYVINGDKVSYIQVGSPAEGQTYSYTSFNAQANQ